MPKQHDMERLTVTPEMAVALLESNRRNRPIRDQHVKRIAAQIKGGKWRYNGDTIKVSDTGNVLDGQHRLWAIIEAKTPVETIVVRGIEEDAFATIDTIRSMRSGGDVLALKGAERFRNQLSEGLKWLLRWQRGCIDTYRAPQHRIENSDVEDAFAKHPTFIKAVERAMSLRGVANPSIMSFIFYVLSNRSFELGERLFDTLKNPVRVRVNDPFFQLRRYFLNSDGHHKDPIVTIALCIKAINAAASGKDVTVLNWKSQGARAEAFPTLGLFKSPARGEAA